MSSSNKSEKGPFVNISPSTTPAHARPLFEDAGAADSWHPPLLPSAIFGCRRLLTTRIPLTTYKELTESKVLQVPVYEDKIVLRSRRSRWIRSRPLRTLTFASSGQTTYNSPIGRLQAQSA